MAATSRTRPPALVVSSSPTRTVKVNGITSSSSASSDLRPPHTLIRSQSKSQQLRAAVAAQAAQVASPQFRPDSMWSEGGADVVWSGQRNGVGLPGSSSSGGYAASIVPPSPEAFHTPRRKFSSEGSNGEFADADEGYDSDEQSVIDVGGNTTLTTVSASGSGALASPTKLVGAAGGDEHDEAEVAGAGAVVAASAMPVRRAGRSLKSPQTPAASSIYSTISSTPTSAAKPTFDEIIHTDPHSSIDAASSYGHTRITSIGSSIWAGRGARSNSNDVGAPPLPRMPHRYSKAIREGASGPRHSTAETSSLYSEGDSSDWERSPAEQIKHETNKFLERNGMPNPLDMQPSTSEESPEQEHPSGLVSAGVVKTPEASPVAPVSKSPRASPERTMADGIKIPPMPPIPARKDHGDREGRANYPPRVRKAKGRRNRSPVLSYADGEAEEQRLELERELRERGGSSTDTSSMGIRLKKNSPAPWEMEDGDAFPDQPQGRPSLEFGHMLPSRPSFDQLIPSALKSSGTRTRKQGTIPRGHSPGPRPSMDVPMPVHPLAASPRIQNSALDGEYGSGANNDFSMSKDALSSPPLVEETSLEQRRRRTKSVTSSAQGVLKSMRLGSGSTSSTPKKAATGSLGVSGGSILAKALRKASGNTGDASTSSSSSRGHNGESSSRSRKTSLNLSKGIGPEDYADRSVSPPPLPTANAPPFNGSHSRPSPQHEKSVLSISTHSQLSADVTRDTLAMPPQVKHSISMTSMRTAAKSDTSSLQSPTSPPSSKRTNPLNLPSSPSANIGTRSVDALSRSPRSAIASARKVSGGADQDLSAMQQHKASEHNRDLSTKDLPAPSEQNGATKDHLARAASPSPSATRSIRQKPTSNSELSASKSNATIKDLAVTPEPPASNAATPEANITRALLTPAGAGMVRLPSVGEHDGVPYKLISLEEARAQQAAQNKVGGRSGDVGNDSMHIPPAASERTINDSVDYSRDSRMRTKKSAGFLRRLAHKDRSNGSSSRDLVSLDAPMAANMPNARSQTSLASAELEIPQLSVRPMSSMFNGFAPGMLDSMAELQSISEDHGSQDQHASSAHNSSHAGTHRPSPAIRINSPESHASSAADFQDAQERTPTLEKGISRMPSGYSSPLPPVASASIRSGGSRAGTSPTRSALSPAERLQTDSMHSDGSSALGIVNGFPPTPEHSSDGFNGLPADMQGNSGQSLAAATRNRALQIEARMVELAKELSRLRAFAVDAGLAKSETASVSSPVSVTSPTGLPKAMGAHPASQRDGETSLDESIDSTDESALYKPIPQCDHCGCLCAEQKRLQTLQDLNVLKGISVLDRGRALKPITGENVGKFGGYLHR